MELDNLIDELVVAAPDLAPLLAEHRADYDELLPYLFLIDIAVLCERLRSGGPHRQAQLAAIMSIMEAAWNSPDGDRVNFSACFVESLDAFADLAALRPLLGAGLGRIADRHHLPQPKPTLRQRGALFLHRMLPGFPKGA